MLEKFGSTKFLLKIGWKMDSFTKWLLRGAALVVIAAGGAGIFTMFRSMNKTSSSSQEAPQVQAPRLIANQCPDGYAYIGGGYCRDWYCTDKYSGHDPDLAGKGWSCEKGALGGLFGNPSMHFREDAPPVRAFVDDACPNEEPDIGNKNSCWNDTQWDD